LKILVIGMADSVHFSRWLSQFKDSEHEFRIVSSSPHRRIHPQLKELLKDSNYSISICSRVLSLPLWGADRFFSDWLRGSLIALQAASFKPDLVHVLEFQNGGYAYLRARSLSKAVQRAKLLLTPYGSDIFWFQRFPAHLAKIRKLLEIADGISSECKRDEMLATNYGFKGQFGPRVPAFGAIDILKPQPDRSARKAIAVKGYQNKWGQALLALKALESVSEQLAGYKVVLYSCNSETIKESKEFARRTGLEVIAHPKGVLPNSEVLRIFRESAVYIGLSTSDGISASMIEAMANGAIPIQSNTSCCGEWLEDKVGGYLTNFDDIDFVATKLLEILRDESWQSRAALENYETLNAKLDPYRTKLAAIETYKNLE
jgi:glycosyltransferase involved in cell wall biosynthesis